MSHTSRPRTRLATLVATACLAAGALVATGPSPIASGEAASARPGSARGAAAVIAAGSAHSCALLVAGDVKCWGHGAFGQLGQGNQSNIGSGPNQMGDDLDPVDLGVGATATAVVAGANHTCALLVAGDVKCWGQNSRGQLGQGHTDNVGSGPNQMGDDLDPVDLGTGRTATALSAGGDHTCALLDDSSLKCWGFNLSGQVGQGHTDNVGSGPNQMGDDLDPVDLGTGRTVTAVTAGAGFTCAILDDASVKCFGSGFLGQTGQGHTDGLGGAPGQMGDALPAVDLGTGRTALAVSAGDNHACAILDEGDLKCWGQNSSGQLGQGHTAHLGNEPGEMGDALDPVDLGSGRTALAVTAGLGFTCALLDDQSVKCWGWGNAGRLGSGSTSNIGNQPGQMGDALDPVDLGTGRTARAVSTGASHACALLDDGTVKCWGNGTAGRLGQGATDNIGDGPNEMGDDLDPVDLGAMASVLPVVATPAAPRDVTATGSAEGEVALAWTPPSDDGGAAVTSYRIERSADGVTWDLTVASTGPVTSYSVGGLDSGAHLRFRVAAINAAGVGVPSLASNEVRVPGAAYLPLDPARLLDTRSPGGTTIDGDFAGDGPLAGGAEIALQVTGRGGVPADAAAVVLNVTVNEPEQAGFVTAYPCNSPRPNASNLNYVPGQTIPNNVIVKLGAGGTVCLYSDQTTNLIADVNGTFSG